MFKGIDHVVVVVRDLEAAISRYETIYGISVSRRLEEAAIGMRMAAFNFTDTYTVLVSNIDERGPIAAWLAERGEGIWIVAMKVDDLGATVAELRDNGVKLVGDPGPGVPVTGRVFIDAIEAGGHRVQLIQR